MTKAMHETLEEIIELIDRKRIVNKEEFIKRIQDDSASFKLAFEASHEFSLTPQAELALNDWYFSETGKKTVKDLTTTVVDLISQVTSNGHPGHDKRHFIKTLFVGLRFVVEDGITDYRQLFLIAAFLHDLGRLVEPHIYGHVTGGVAGVDHPKISYLLTHQLLEHFPDMPEQLKHHLLYAVLVHQQGNSDTFMAQTVQRCDREQLVGAEGIARIIAFNVGLHHLNLTTAINDERKTSLPLPGSETDTDVMHQIEFYTRNLFKVIGTEGEHHMGSLKKISGKFLFLASTEVIKQQIFAPEIKRMQGAPSYSEDQLHFKKPLSEDIWKFIQAPLHEDTLAQIAQTSALPLKELLIKLVTPKNAMIAPHEIDNIVSQITSLDVEAHLALKEAVSYALIMRERLDSEQAELVATITTTFPKDSLEYEIATLVNKELMY